MYSGRDKIVKKKDEKTTETEDEVAKAFFELENTNVEGGVEGIKKVKFTKAEYVSEGENKVLLIVVPFPLYTYVKKNFATISNYLAGKFKVPVFLVAQRTILSKYGKNQCNQGREAQGISKETNEQNFNISP
jgi:small subunit ribosomal protein S7e